MRPVTTLVRAGIEPQENEFGANRLEELAGNDAPGRDKQARWKKMLGLVCSGLLRRRMSYSTSPRLFRKQRFASPNHLSQRTALGGGSLTRSLSQSIHACLPAGEDGLALFDSPRPIAGFAVMLQVFVAAGSLYCAPSSTVAALFNASASSSTSCCASFASLASMASFTPGITTAAYPVYCPGA